MKPKVLPIACALALALVSYQAAASAPDFGSIVPDIDVATIVAVFVGGATMYALIGFSGWVTRTLGRFFDQPPGLSFDDPGFIEASEPFSGRCYECGEQNEMGVNGTYGSYCQHCGAGS